MLSVPAGVCGRAAHDAATPPASGNGASLDAQLTCLDNATGPGAHRANTAAAAFAVTLSVPHLNRSSRMSTSSLLLAWLAWLAFICTSLADADVVAGTTSKCVSESPDAHQHLMKQHRCGICQKSMDGSPFTWLTTDRSAGGWWMVDGSSRDWCEVGTDTYDKKSDCADCAACCATWEGTNRETRSWCDCPSPPSLPRYSHIGAVGLPTPPSPSPLPPPPPVARIVLVPATRYTVSFHVSGVIMGIVIAAVVGVLLIAGGVVMHMKNKKKAASGAAGGKAQGGGRGAHHSERSAPPRRHALETKV